MLAFRNLVRGKFYDVPSGEAIAEAMDVKVVGDDPVFPEGTPLWYYVLREAEMTVRGRGTWPGRRRDRGGGLRRPTPVGRRLPRRSEKPNLPDVSGGDFRIGDLLVAADQPQVDEPRPPAEQPYRGGEVRPLPTNNFTGRDPTRGGTASTNNFTEQMTLLMSDPGGTASSNNFTEQMTKNAAFGRGLDRFDEPDHRGSRPCHCGFAP